MLAAAAHKPDRVHIHLKDEGATLIRGLGKVDDGGAESKIEGLHAIRVLVEEIAEIGGGGHEDSRRG